ncbi:MAG: NADH:ubiquinone reductase (Na(+)-transporting) subunit C [Paludibacteraceae bacterium]|nr:NADH:ubiquinone reductase (Na(+)-transporting) subunit C [Paludibacteraceae bacterium]MBQ9752625.1 NADH:ubiquinone reductase (Na(+)-transporting) subunit C [Paludibacteraceae bacterium]
MAQKKFVCSVCGYVHNGDKAPEVCPQCKQSGVFVEEKKKGLDTNSNAYTVIYATIIVVIVAVLLALVSQVLSPRQEANRLLDQQKQILVALNQNYDNTDPAALYLSLVNDTIDVNGAPVFVANIEGNTKYVLKLHGAGLWGGIGGYLALDADKNTIYGINFNHESETPGLGAEIVTEKFRSQFPGKHIRNAAGEVVSVAVLKAGKVADGQEQVDALSGATITCDGVSTMIATNLAEYAEFLNEDSNVYVKTAFVLLDGVVYEGDLDAIDPNTIEHITVLKDSAAIATYGEAAKEGAIVITTKKSE